MKKLLALLLTVILLTSGCASSQSLQKTETIESSVEDNDQRSDPPAIVMLRSQEAFDELRALLSEPDDEIVEEYLQNSVENCLENREELIAFLAMLDAFPVPFIPATKLDAVSYWPGDDYRSSISFFLKSDKEEVFSFRFIKLHNSEISENFEKIIETDFEATPNLIYEIEAEKNIKVYEYPGKIEPGQEYINFTMDINGYCVRFGYRNDVMENILEVIPERIFAHLTLGNINDAKWKYAVNGWKFNGSLWDLVEILNEDMEEASQIEQAYDSIEYTSYSQAQ